MKKFFAVILVITVVMTFAATPVSACFNKDEETIRQLEILEEGLQKINA